MSVGNTVIRLMDCCELADPARFEIAMERVDAARREKVETSSDEERLLRLGVGLLSAALLRERGIDTARLMFDERGKPIIEGGAAFISLAHAGKWAMVGLSDAPIAVDVELHRPDEWGIAEHFFTPEERAVLASSAEPEVLFWRLWSRKECLIKLVGLRDLRELSALEAPHGTLFWDYPIPGYSCVVCSATSQEPELRIMSLDEILNKA